MNKSLTKLMTIVILVLSVLGAVLYGMSMDGGDSAIGNYVGYALLLLFAAAGIAVLFSLLNLFKKPAVLKKTLLSLAVLGVVLAVAYMLADGGTVLDAKGNIFEITKQGSTSKWVDTGIMYSLILLAVGSALFVWDMLKNLIK